jgi:hypothetical protein
VKFGSHSSGAYAYGGVRIFTPVAVTVGKPIAHQLTLSTAFRPTLTNSSTALTQLKERISALRSQQ